MKIMGIDYGTKRIGVAISDGLLITAQGFCFIESGAPEENFKKIRQIASDNGVVEIVVGLPLNMNGTHSQKTKEVLAFVEALTRAVDIPVKTWDERLTTVSAERVLLEADVSRAKRKKAVDKLAAQLMLQNYLDFKKR